MELLKESPNDLESFFYLNLITFAVDFEQAEFS